MRKQNLLSKIEAERLLAFTNNSGPLFIVGTVGITLFGNSTIGYLLLVTHLLSCITVGIIFKFWKYSDKSYTNTSNPSNYSNNLLTNNNILYDSIFNSIKTVFLIGGFVILFSVILSILKNSGAINLLLELLKPVFHIFNIDSIFHSSFITGIIELTNGISNITTIPYKAISTNIILCSFLLGFAGICVLLQVYSIIASSDISIKPYILGKILHGALAALYTYIIIKNISFFNLDLEPVFANNISIKTDFILNYFEHYNIIILCIILFLIFIALTLKRKISKAKNYN